MFNADTAIGKRATSLESQQPTTTEPHTEPNHKRQQINRESAPRVQHPQLRTVRVFTRHWPSNDVGQQDVRNISATPSRSSIRKPKGKRETVADRCFFRQEDRASGDAQRMQGPDWLRCGCGWGLVNLPPTSFAGGCIACPTDNDEGRAAGGWRVLYVSEAIRCRWEC